MNNIFGWLCLIVVLLGAGAAAGVFGYGWLTQSQRQAIADRERAIRDEWEALHLAQQLNQEFWEARTAMRAAATNQARAADKPPRR